VIIMRLNWKRFPRSSFGQTVSVLLATLAVSYSAVSLAADPQPGARAEQKLLVPTSLEGAAPADLPNAHPNLLALFVGAEVSACAPRMLDLVQVATMSVWAQDYKKSLQRIQADRPDSLVVQAKLKDFDNSLLAATQTVVPAVGVISQVVNTEDKKVPSNVIYVRFSKPFLETYFCKNFERISPVRDNVLGAEVYGTSRTVARTELGLVDNPNSAQANLLFKGTTAFNSTSYKGPVQIFAHGTTAFTSEKKIYFDGTDIRQSDPKITAHTNTITDGIGTDLPGLRRRIALRIAGNREAESHALAEEIASDRTKRKVATAFDQVVREQTAMFGQRLREQYAKLPIEGRFCVQTIQCSTTPDSLQIVVLGRGEDEPTYATAPAILKDNPDVELHIHSALVQKAIFDPEMRATLQLALQSMVNNPMKSAASVIQTASTSEPQRELHIHWTEGNGEWLSLAWHAKEKPDAEPKPSEFVGRGPISMPLVSAPIPGR
jgi:hypothetical protein